DRVSEERGARSMARPTLAPSTHHLAPACDGQTWPSYRDIVDFDTASDKVGAASIARLPVAIFRAPSLCAAMWKTFLAIVLSCVPLSVHAEVVRLEIRQRSPFAGGQRFGAAG